MDLRSGAALGLLCAGLAGPSPSLAQEPDPAPAEATLETAPSDEAREETLAGDGDLEAYWSRRLANASKRVEVARERVEKAEAEYSRARHDRNPRGGTLEAIKERRVAAERELEEAEAALPRLVEQARRAGVPAGVLRDYWDDE